MQSNDENGKSSLRISAIDRFIKAICRRPETPIWEEILGNPVVQQHLHLATVWVPFQFIWIKNYPIVVSMRLH